MKIPVMSPSQQHELKGHERLSCDSCNPSWAPKCDGCHIEYDPQEAQCDHLRQKRTPGRWIEKCLVVESGIPALSVTSKNRITLYVPGMNLILKTSPVAVSVLKTEFCTFVNTYISA